MRHRFFHSGSHHPGRIPPQLLLTQLHLPSVGGSCGRKPVPASGGWSVGKIMFAALGALAVYSLVGGGGSSTVAPTPPAARAVPTALVTPTATPWSLMVPHREATRAVRSLQSDDGQAFDEYLGDVYLSRLPRP